MSATNIKFVLVRVWCVCDSRPNQPQAVFDYFLHGTSCYSSPFQTFCRHKLIFVSSCPLCAWLSNSESCHIGGLINSNRVLGPMINSIGNLRPLQYMFDVSLPCQLLYEVDVTDSCSWEGMALSESLACSFFRGCKSQSLRCLAVEPY